MKLLDVAEAATLLHRSENTVRAMCRRGDLRASKDDCGWLIDERDIAAYLNAKSNRPRKVRAA